MKLRVLLVALASTGCLVTPNTDDMSEDESAAELRKRRTPPVTPPVATPVLADGRYVIRGSQAGSTTLLAGVVLSQAAGSRVVDVTTSHGTIKGIPVSADGSFSRLGPASGRWQWKADGRVSFDGETLRYELTETQVAPGRSSDAYSGQLGLGSVLVQAAASNGGKFAAGVTSQSVAGSWFTGYPTMTNLVAFQTPSGRIFITEPDALAGSGCLSGYALELPSNAGVATLATATGATCGDWDPCNTHFSARIVVGPTSLNYGCQRGGESHWITAPVPTLPR